MRKCDKDSMFWVKVYTALQLMTLRFLESNKIYLQFFLDFFVGLRSYVDHFTIRVKSDRIDETPK